MTRPVFAFAPRKLRHLAGLAIGRAELPLGGAQFARYVGRLGTPDPDFDLVIQRLT